MKLRRTDPTFLFEDIRDMLEPFNLTEAELGHRLADAAARGIMEYMEAECGPEGWPWQRLHPEYAAWKETVAPGAPISVLYGIMRTMEQLTGEVDVHARHAEQTYGLDDKARTEAEKFQEGGAVTGTNQPPRPFYDFNKAACNNIESIADGVWKDKEPPHRGGKLIG